MKRKYGVTDHLRKISVDEITWGKIWKQMAGDLHFLFLIFEVQAIVYKLAKNKKKLSVGTYHHDSP